MRGFANWVVVRRRLVLILAVLLLIPSAIGMVATRVNYDILSYLPPELPSMQAQDLLENDYGMAATAIITVEGLETSELLSMKADIAQVPGVKKVIWQDDLLDVSVPSDMLPTEIRELYVRPDATLLLVTFDEKSASTGTMNAISKIERILRKDCFIGGLSAILQDTKALADQEIGFYVGLAVLLSMVVLFLGVRSTFAPVVFMLGILFPVLYNMGSNVFLGQVSYITKSLAAVLQLGVTMDFSIFLYHRFEEECESGVERQTAMAHAIVKTFSAIAGSSLTTIAGFLAMCAMSLSLGMDIGIVMAKGVVLGVLSTVTVLPAMILLFDRWMTRSTHPILIPKLKRLPRFAVKHRYAVLLIFLLLLVPFGLAQQRTGVYYTMTDALPADMTAIVGTNRMKDQFDMATTHFIFVSDQLTNKQITQMTDELTALPGITSTLSVEQFLGGGIPEDFIPDDILELTRKAGKKMIVANSNERPATDTAAAELERMNEIVHRYDPDALIGGEGAMTQDLVSVCDEDFTRVNYVSIALVFLIIAVVFRSISIPVLLVVVIEGAIAINMGIPYFTGETIPFIASIVIGTIQLGATVDYAILTTTRFQEALAEGRSPTDAAAQAGEACSQSILTSALTFFGATFGVALISKIELIRGLCQMIARGALISMVVILVILPPILAIFSGLIRKTTWGKKA